MDDIAHMPFFSVMCRYLQHYGKVEAFDMSLINKKQYGDRKNIQRSYYPPACFSRH